MKIFPGKNNFTEKYFKSNKGGVGISEGFKNIAKIDNWGDDYLVLKSTYVGVAALGADEDPVENRFASYLHLIICHILF